MNSFWKLVRKIYYKVLWEIGVIEDIDRATQRLRNIGFKIGSNVFLDNTKIEENYPEFLEIEDNVTIAYDTRILLHDSSMNNLFKDPVRFGKVLIKDGAYIGSRCIIMPGVVIGKRALVGAGSIVTKDVPDGMIVMGSPAKIYMSIIDYREKYLSSMANDKYFYWEIEPFMERLNDPLWQKKESESYKNFIENSAIQKKTG